MTRSCKAFARIERRTMRDERKMLESIGAKRRKKLDEKKEKVAEKML